MDNPTEIGSQAKSARDQLDNPRANTDRYGNPITEWKIRIKVRDDENPWPGTKGSPATAANFKDKLIDQLVNQMKWIAKDREQTQLTIEGVNDPTISVANHRQGNRRDILHVEARGCFVQGAKGRKTKKIIKFIVINRSTNKKIMEEIKEHDTATDPNYEKSDTKMELDFKLNQNSSQPLSPNWN